MTVAFDRMGERKGSFHWRRPVFCAEERASETLLAHIFALSAPARSTAAAQAVSGSAFHDRKRHTAVR